MDLGVVVNPSPFSGVDPVQGEGGEAEARARARAKARG